MKNRKKLRKYLGKRVLCSGILAANNIDHVLFTDLNVGRAKINHVWLRTPIPIGSFSVGDRIEFEATVTHYIDSKGGRKYGLNDGRNFLSNHEQYEKCMEDYKYMDRRKR